jgi:hypothetical protein
MRRFFLEHRILNCRNAGAQGRDPDKKGETRRVEAAARAPAKGVQPESSRYWRYLRGNPGFHYAFAEILFD